MKKILIFCLIGFSVLLQNYVKADNNEFFILDYMGYPRNVTQDGRYVVGTVGQGGFIFDTETGEMIFHEAMIEATAVTIDKAVAGLFLYYDYPMGETTKNVVIAGIWENGDWTPLNLANLVPEDILSGDGTKAYAMSNDKKVVGGQTSKTAASFVYPCVWTKNEEDDTWDYEIYKTPDHQGHPALRNGRILSMSGDGSIVTGWTNTPTGSRVPTIWKSANDYIRLEGTGPFDEASDISKNGKYVGISINRHAAIYYMEDDVYEMIPVPPDANSSYVTSITDEGIAVGFAQFGDVSSGWRFGFVYSPALGYYDLNDYIQTFAPDINISPLDFSSQWLTVPMAISNDGKTIAGWWGSSSAHQVPWVLKLAESPVVLNRPSNLQVSVVNHKEVSLTWDAPEIMSGYTLTGYKIYRNNEFFSEIGASTTEFYYNDYDNGRHYLSVAAVYDDKMSPKSDYVFIEIYDMSLPFVEDFESGNLTRNFWTLEPVSSNPWRIMPYAYRGLPHICVTFVSSSAVAGNSYSMISKELEALDAENVYLKFALKYNFTSYSFSEEVLNVEVLVDSEWETVASYSKADLKPGTGLYGWNVETIDLSDFAAGKMFQVRFRVYCSKTEYNTIDIDNIRIDITPFSEFAKAPKEPNLDIINNNTADVNWKTPKNTYNLTYFNGISDWAIANDGVSFIAANSFDPDNLTPYMNKYLSSITAYIIQMYIDTQPHELSLVIFYGDQRIEQPIGGFVPNSWNTFILDTPLLLDEAVNLKFGIKVISHHPEELVIGLDNSVIDREGNLYSEDDGITWHRLYDESINNNLAIIGDITDSDSDISDIEFDNDFIGYLLYRNLQNINKSLIYKTSYRDISFDIQSYFEYNVTAYYKNGAESNLSETFVYDPEGTILKPDNFQINIAPNPVSDFINIKGNFSKATLIDTAGKTVLETKDNVISVSHLPNGIYLLKIEDGALVTVCKIIKR